MLLPQYYNRLEQEMKNAIRTTLYQDPQLGGQLCYRSDTVINAPILKVYFDGGGQVAFAPYSIAPSFKLKTMSFALQWIRLPAMLVYLVTLLKAISELGLTVIDKSFHSRK